MSSTEAKSVLIFLKGAPPELLSIIFGEAFNAFGSPL